MGILLRKRQPQHPVSVAAQYAEYIQSYRIWSLPPEASFDSGPVNGLAPFTKTGTIDVVASIDGIGVKGDGTTGLYSRTVSVVPQAMWMAVQFVCNSVTTTQKVAYSLGSASATTGAYCAISSGDSLATNLVFQLRAIDSAAAIGKTGPVPVVGTVYSCIVVFPSNLKADAYVYVNGIKYTADFTGSSDITFVGANTLVNEAVGALKRGTTAVYSSDTVLFTARGLGQIPEALAKQISENPSSILKGLPSRKYAASLGNTTAAINQTLDDATLSSSAHVKPLAAINQTLADATLSASAGTVTSAAINQTLDDATLSSSAHVKPLSAINQTLADATLSSSTHVKPLAAINKTLDAATLSSSAHVKPLATINQTLDAATLAASAASASGTSNATASLNKTLEDTTLSSNVHVKPLAALNVTTDDSILSSTAFVSALASINQTLQNTTMSSEAFVRAAAAINTTLANSTLVSTVSVKAVASIIQTLANTTLTGSASVSATIATLTSTLDDTTLIASASGYIPAGLTLSETDLIAIVSSIRAGLAAELTMISELHKLHGLDINNPLVVNNNTNRRTAGAINQSVITSGNTTTVTRL